MMRLKKNSATSKSGVSKIRKKLNGLEKVKYIPDSWIARGLILFFVFLDYLFTQQLTDAYFIDDAMKIIVSALGIALLIDVSPSIIAGCINVKVKKPIHYIGMALTLCALITGFGLLAYLRIHSGDLIYSMADTALTSVVATEMAGTVNIEGQNAMTYLFCLMPIFTSIVCFMISLFDESPNEETTLRHMAVMEYENELAKVEADNLERQRELERDLYGRNQRLKDLELDDIDQEEIIVKELIKMSMAKQVGTPQAVTDFMGATKS